MPIVLSKNFPESASAGQRSIPDNFAEAVSERAHSNRFPYDFVYIVPTRRRVRELQREFIKGVAFGKLPIYTLELFAHEIFSVIKIGRRTISPSMQGMMVARILSRRSQISAGDDFKYFRVTRNLPAPRASSGRVPAGTIKKIVDQIDYLRENGITPEDYEQMLAAADDSERTKLEEFLRIYRRYEESLGENLIDAAGLLSVVNHELKSSPQTGFAKAIGLRLSSNIAFFVEGFYNFKRPELEFLRILSSRKDFSFFIKLDCDDNNDNLFRTMMGTASELVARGFTKEDIGTGKRTAATNLREYFSSNLFAEEAQPTRIDLKEKVFVVSVQDKLREIEFVAEKIKEIIKKNQPAKLDAICVASYLPQTYSHLIREVFAKYQIPANVTDRYTLDTNNVVNAILSFIDIKLTDYERGAVLRAITNNILTIADDMTASEAGSLVYHAAALCRFERGLRSFRESISFHLQFLNRIAKSGAEVEESGDTEIYRDIRTLAKTRQSLGLY